MSHERYLPPGRVLAFAHRGGAELPGLAGLENTLVAFRHAVDLGYSYLETDLHVTKDGVLLAFHDDVLDRVTDSTGAVAEQSLAEIRSARVCGREPIPTFQDLLDEFPNACFNLDLKSAAAGPALARLVDDHDALGPENPLAGRLLVGSFSVRRIREFRRLTRNLVATAAHPLEILAFRYGGARLGRLVGPSVAALQVPHRHRGVEVVTAGLVRNAHAAGVQVHVWTIDDPVEMHVLLDLGVDGIFTDRTDLLKDVLVERGQWWSRLEGEHE